MDFKYKEINSPIPNAKVERMLLEGEFKGYRVTPLTDYVLHDTARDSFRYDYDTDENGDIIEIVIPMLGYGGQSTCAPSYAFTPIEMQDEAGNTVTAYGERSFFCKLARDISANRNADIN